MDLTFAPFYLPSHRHVSSNTICPHDDYCQSPQRRLICFFRVFSRSWRRSLANLSLGSGNRLWKPWKLLREPLQIGRNEAPKRLRTRTMISGLEKYPGEVERRLLPSSAWRVSVNFPVHYVCISESSKLTNEYWLTSHVLVNANKIRILPELWWVQCAFPAAEEADEALSKTEKKKSHNTLLL